MLYVSPRAGMAVMVLACVAALTGCVRDPGPPQQATAAEAAAMGDLTVQLVDARSLDELLGELRNAPEVHREHLIAEYLFVAGGLDGNESARAIQRLEEITGGR